MVRRFGSTATHPASGWRSEDDLIHDAATSNKIFLRSVRFVIVILLALAVVPIWYFLSDPVRQLRTEPPAEFTERSGLPADGDQLQLAREYWECARRIQWKYTYGEPLPAAPPPEFRTSEEDGATSRQAAKIRQIYWQRLQHVWLDPDSWDVKRTLSLDSIFNRLR